MNGFKTRPFSSSTLPVAGKTHLAHIFTKLMRGGVHFCGLRHFLISRLSNFRNASLFETHHACQCSSHTVTPSAAWVSTASCASSYFSALAANTFCQSVMAVSHLSNAGPHLLGVFMVSSLQITFDIMWCFLHPWFSCVCCLPSLGNPLGLPFSAVFAGGIWSVRSPL
jgi:hypothetical protein